jgi:hypothetical protein
LDLENGKIEEVPAHLNKATPNFHLLMLATDDDDRFCKTTLSAMILNYPTPTIVSFYDDFEDTVRLEKGRLEGVLRYLGDAKRIRDEDLVLVVDGRDTWFQLPSEVIIRQYQNVLDDANKRLARKYGENVMQTIVFGAVKMCEGEDLACGSFPSSMLPNDIYGKETGKDLQRTPARYLDSAMLMGPAKDLRVLYEAAVKIFSEGKSQQQTVQSVMATIFGEQQMARNAQVKRLSKPVPSKWLDYLGGSAAEIGLVELERNLNATLGEDSREFKIGLDYSHTLFQPLQHSAPDELIPLIHDNSTDLSRFHHPGTPTPPLTIPFALQQAKLPFWSPDFHTHNPSPNEKPAYIDKLEMNSELDRLKHRDTTWEQIKLIQNTFTGAVPAVLHADNGPPLNVSRARRSTRKRPVADIAWKSLWYATYERALLRKYFRNPQSPVGYHTAAIGGDRLWDTRGGRGGVWTEKEGLWLPWGEVDGVCGSVEQIRNAFGDGKGVWLHELDEGMGEKGRDDEEAELWEKILEKERSEIEKEMERLKVEQERARKEQEEREKQKLGEVEVEKQDNLQQLIHLLMMQEEQKANEQEEAERMERERALKAYNEREGLVES